MSYGQVIGSGLRLTGSKSALEKIRIWIRPKNIPYFSFVFIDTNCLKSQISICIFFTLYLFKLKTFVIYIIKGLKKILNRIQVQHGFKTESGSGLYKNWLLVLYVQEVVTLQKKYSNIFASEK